MNDGAGVQSLDALQDWQAALTIFRTEGLDALASVTSELNRLEGWLSEKLQFWHHKVRDYEEEVAQAKNELRNRSFPDWSGRIPDTTVQEENLRDAERRLDFARDQIQVVRRWIHRLPAEITEIYEGAGRHLSNFLDGEVPRGLAMLSRAMDAIEKYLQVLPESAPPPRKGTP